MAKSGSPLDCDESDYDSVETTTGCGKLDRQRFEKISEIVKSFRKSCQRTGEQFVGFESHFDEITAVLEPLTKNTFILIVCTDPRAQTAMVKYNIHQSQLHIAEVGTQQTMQRKCK